MVYRIIFRVDDKFLAVKDERRYIDCRPDQCARSNIPSIREQHHQCVDTFGRVEEQGWRPSPPHDCVRDIYEREEEVKYPLSVGFNLWMALKVLPWEVQEMKRTLLRARNASRTSFARPLELQNLFSYWSKPMLTHVGLNFSIYDYFTFFGTPFLRPGTVPYVGTMEHLTRNIPTLHTLDIKFRDPRWSIWETPWPGTAHDLKNVAKACHREIVRLILMCATLDLLRVRTVRIEGYLEKRTTAVFYEKMHKLRIGDPITRQRFAAFYHSISRLQAQFPNKPAHR